MEPELKALLDEGIGLDTEGYRLLVTPTGRFEIGGPMGDAGLTGRKIIIDTYGGMARHGGGAFSGKDPSKVDRSAAYAMRWVAKNVVAAGLASRCEVQVAYAIGKAEPVGLFVETFGTHKIDPEKIEKAIDEVFDLRPAAIIRDLDLLRPIYSQTAAYGHFGRELPGLHLGAHGPRGRPARRRGPVTPAGAVRRGPPFGAGPRRVPNQPAAARRMRRRTRSVSRTRTVSSCPSATALPPRSETWTSPRRPHRPGRTPRTAPPSSPGPSPHPPPRGPASPTGPPQEPSARSPPRPGIESAPITSPVTRCPGRTTSAGVVDVRPGQVRDPDETRAGVDGGAGAPRRAVRRPRRGARRPRSP